ncbi:hypothetical protein MHYP_G00274860 [Metynnis hypsauchen]
MEGPGGCIEAVLLSFYRLKHPKQLRVCQLMTFHSSPNRTAPKVPIRHSTRFSAVLSGLRAGREPLSVGSCSPGVGVRLCVRADGRLRLNRLNGRAVSQQTWDNVSK